VHADNSHHLAASATARSKAAVARALASIDALSRTGQPVTFPAVAKHAGVSRAFLYANEDVRRALVEARARTTPATSPPPEVRASDASLRPPQVGLSILLRFMPRRVGRSVGGGLRGWSLV